MSPSRPSARFPSVGALILAVLVIGWFLPPAVMGAGVGELPEDDRPFAEEVRHWSYVLIWENPIEKGLIRHVKVLEVVAVDRDTAPPCGPGVTATLEQCIPAGVPSRADCGVGFTDHPRWMTAHLRAYTWGGVPFSDALVGCGGAQRL